MRLRVALVFVIYLFLPITQCVPAVDSLTPGQTLRDGQTLVSADQTFEAGFFNPENSEKRYVGVWFKDIPGDSIVWVANRDRPLADRSGVLTVTETGNVVISSNSTARPVWSSNSSAAKSPALQLLGTGNLVVRAREGESGDRRAWESFDHPCDTLIAGMKLGWDLRAGREWKLSSWKSPDDPAAGNFTYEVDPRGLPQLIQRTGKIPVYRSGPWDGVRFGADPAMGPNPIYTPEFVFNGTHTYYAFEVADKSVLTRFVVGPTGEIEQFRWNLERREWLSIFALRRQDCDEFLHCGPNGVCDDAAGRNGVMCRCPVGFGPRAPRDWERFDWSGGCVARPAPGCSGFGFRRMGRMKLPYGEEFRAEAAVTRPDECRAICRGNCSCTAYALGRVGGCMLWFGDLLDMTHYYHEGGQDLYLRVAASYLDKTNRRRTMGIISVSVLSCILLLVLIGAYFIRKRICNVRESQAGMSLAEQDLDRHSRALSEDVDLPIFDLETVVKATDNFSLANKIGEGGFGPVYKGLLPSGEEIAVKRLSKESGQGVIEFKNEVILIAKLQHRNLVKVLGCCIHREERMLIYEYMPNKSLELYIFKQTKGSALDWQKRFDIIVGVARGLLYLHRDSRLRIIHRDMKASNILLDNDMNPKISDFGLARIFGGDQTEANTRTVVGTYGYMSPEYAIDGLFSVKSDVFSFGVLVLEIISGQKNRGFEHPEHNLNLLGHAWRLWSEGKPLDLTDELMKEFSEAEVLRCIQVGLLCVQRRPEDRPLMSAVLFMLEADGLSPLQPNQPGFYMERFCSEADSSSSWNNTNNTAFTSTELTVTKLQGR